MHTSESIVMPKSIDKEEFLSILNKYPFNPYIKDKENLKLNYCQKIIFDLDFKKERKTIMLKDRQHGCSTALLFRVLNELKTNKNFSVMFLTYGSNIKNLIERCYIILSDKNVKTIGNNKLEIGNSTIQFLGHGNNINQYFRGTSYDLVVWDEINVKDFTQAKSCFNKNFIGLVTLESNLNVFKHFWNINEPNLNVLPVYLQLLPDLTQESEFVGKSLIENYG